MKSNFDFLKEYRLELAEIGSTAEGYVYSDPNACLFKLGLFAERLVEQIIGAEKLSGCEELTQAERVKLLRREGIIPRHIDDILFAIRKARNDAVHNGLDSREDAQTLLHMAHSLSLWFMEIYGPSEYTPVPFRLPPNPDAQNSLPPDTEMPSAEQTSSAENSKSDHSFALSEAEAAYLNRERIRVESSVLPIISYALEQNRIPIIQELSVINNSEQVLEHADLYIHTSPEMCFSECRHIEYIPAGSSCEIRNIPLRLNMKHLAGCTAKATCLLYISLIKNGETLFTETTDIAVLPFDQWQGTSYYPELLSAFVTPNHPEISILCTHAARLLKEATGDPSLSGYQSCPDRVLAQAAAIYAAMQNQQVVYAASACGFEEIGQRIRMSGSVLQQKIGTSLDMALLYASCIESVGLNPLLVVFPETVCCGVWLEDFCFPEAVLDDSALLSRHLSDDTSRLVLIDPSLSSAGKNISFEDSVRSAVCRLSQGEALQCAVDIGRARLLGISSLPFHAASSLQTALPSPSDPVSAPSSSEAKPLSRMARWERKLLDLSLRNALINMHLSRTVIPLLPPSAQLLIKALSLGGSELLLRPSPDSFDQTDFESLCIPTECPADTLAEFEDGYLRTALNEDALTRTAKALYRTARTVLEENGANALYIAAGALRWYENSHSTQPHYAPLLLFPIDIVRKSGSQEYALRLRDEEVQVNITLLEMLRQEFSLSIPLPEFLPSGENGVDVQQILSTVRQAIVHQPRWTVLDSASIGSFCFSQFVMWNDLKNRAEDLQNNKIVRSLLDGTLAWDAHSLPSKNHISEDGLLLPVPADASQLAAVEAACRGESFVLHGPPGTGKSQTITAIIANILAQGQTVLFVSEKMAALEVVEHRLEQIGLSPFCLQLHSNKARKKDVLDRLRRTVEISRSACADEYTHRREQLHALRKKLDEYRTALHKTLACGYSVYELINRYEACPDVSELTGFSDASADRITPELLAHQFTLLERLRAIVLEIGRPHKHPLRFVQRTVYSQQLREELVPAVRRYHSALTALDSAARELIDPLPLNAPSSLNDWHNLYDIASEIPIWLELPRCLKECPDLGMLCAAIHQIIQNLQRASSLRTRLLTLWKEEFLELDGQKLLAEYREAAQKGFFEKVWTLNTLSAQILRHSKSDWNRDTLEKQLFRLAEYQKARDSAEQLIRSVSPLLGPLLSAASSDWQLISQIADLAKATADRLDSLSRSDKLRQSLCCLKIPRDLPASFREKWDDADKVRQALYALLDISFDETSDWLSGQLAICKTLEAHSDGLKSWMTWTGAVHEAEQADLKPAISAFCSDVPLDDVIPSFSKTLYRLLIRHAVDSTPTLKQFSGAVFNEQIERFKQLDKEFIQVTREEIFCRLAARIPDLTVESAHNSEPGILQRAIRSGGRGLSIRKLFEQIPTLLSCLCPCMLMSPLSAAQYLPLHREAFDLVIFDEASQLPTCKAVGVLARGKNAVIAGDPNQMPPTSFFAASAFDEEHPESDDLESILDDCLAMNMPQSHLLWHYRSRHESLIAFCNNRFYENRLLTFPSAADLHSNVRLIHVNGIFERGKSRQNRAEAESVIRELIRRSHDSSLCHLSVGIITFNAAQQNLIDDLFADACRKDPHLEQWALRGKEPLFIKNLENVQGDERDVILFSIGYGPDENGKISMNFGPLNRSGGWRRLNVAASRARHEMTVYASLTPEQINLTRTASDGTAALKAFLKYASDGQLPASEEIFRNPRYNPCIVAKALHKALCERGWDTRMNIGRSQHRIDLGVVDPDCPDRYLLGILLDGSAYQSARTTRDREIAQIAMYHDLGWNIHRLWTMDWWEHPQREIERIIEHLDSLRTHRPSPPHAAPTPPVIS